MYHLHREILGRIREMNKDFGTNPDELVDTAEKVSNIEVAAISGSSSTMDASSSTMGASSSTMGASFTTMDASSSTMGASFLSMGASSSTMDESSNKAPKGHVTDLPVEVVQHILRYLPYENISKIRLVSRYFNNVCSSMLNSEFSRLRILVQQKFLTLKSQMPRRESSRRKHPLARQSDIIETLYMRLTLLNMTFGKHMERKYCCFFPGEIIDEIYKILQYVQTTPSLSRAYKVTDELFDLSTMAMEYFKEHIEPTLPEVTYFTSDVYEFPSFSSVKAHQTILEETVGASSSDTPRPSSSSSIELLKKKMKLTNKKVTRNTKDIGNMKRSIKNMSRKINSLSEVINQLKWQQKGCDTTTLPESHKMNEILMQLNVCKHEIEKLNAKISSCSEKQSKLNLESLENSINGNTRSVIVFNDKISDTKPTDRYLKVPKLVAAVTETSNIETESAKDLNAINLCDNAIGKRKRPSSSITSSDEHSDNKRSCIYVNDSENVDDQNSFESSIVSTIL